MGSQVLDNSGFISSASRFLALAFVYTDPGILSKDSGVFFNDLRALLCVADDAPPPEGARRGTVGPRRVNLDSLEHMPLRRATLNMVHRTALASKL